MAKQNVKQKSNKANQSPPVQGSDSPKTKGSGILFGILAFITAIIIIGGVFGGAFYYAVHNNINGIGERLRPQIQGIPIIKLALTAPDDPEDPKYITDKEIRGKYDEMRKLKNELLAKLDIANKTIADLTATNAEIDKIKAEDATLKLDTQKQTEQIAAQQKKLNEDLKKLSDMIASGDKDGFKSYFEKVDPVTAQKIYAQVMQQQRVSEDAQKFAKYYEAMEPSVSAAILEQMGTSKIDLTVQILQNMKQGVATQIMAAMTPTFASAVTDRLSKQYIREIKN